MSIFTCVGIQSLGDQGGSQGHSLRFLEIKMIPCGFENKVIPRGFANVSTQII
jgi:hypothetical protein